ncbi:hypothetical protein [Phormidesmis priestleyi]|uniref:hypothetical protein n=1 Tax=Phormidesmis priestleyi TaxID=268141 RepID=UPI00116069CF|nr:hypothetical protein [Phormidesmis priestleyi]
MRALQWKTQYFKRAIITLLGESSEQSDDPDQFKDTIAGRLLNSPSIISATHSLSRRNRSVILSEVSPQVFAEALLDVLQSLPQPNDLGTRNDNTAGDAIAHFMAIINASPDLSPRLRANLQRIIDRVQSIDTNAERQMVWLKYEIGFWFRHAMANASNAYKHRYKLVSFLVSLVLVIAVNIDSLYIIRRISENTATRAVILQNVTQVQGCRDNLNSPKCVERLSLLMESTTIPIGWQPSNRRRQFAQFNGIILLRTIGGWLLTSLAVAMGSRFWLQLFNRFVTLLGK